MAERVDVNFQAPRPERVREALRQHSLTYDPSTGTGVGSRD